MSIFALRPRLHYKGYSRPPEKDASCKFDVKLHLRAISNRIISLMHRTVRYCPADRLTSKAFGHTASLRPTLEAYVRRL